MENWLRLKALREEDRVLQEQINLNQIVLDLQQKRHAYGVASALDVLQQQEILARAKAQLPDVESDQELTLHQLAVLIGRNPSEPLSIPSFSYQAESIGKGSTLEQQFAERIYQWA